MELRKMIFLMAGVIGLAIGAFYVFSTVVDRSAPTPATTTATPATPR